jgi:hypothetical protein
VPPEHDPLSTQSDWEIWKPRLRVPKWLEDNPGLVVSALYLALSAVGLLYQFFFFRRFQLNVLEFSDATDFLMVVVREPLTVAMASLGLGFYWVYMKTSLAVAAWCYRRWPKLRKDPAKLAADREKARRIAPGLQLAFILTYALVFTQGYAIHQSKRARDGDFAQVTVQFKADAVATAEPFKATLLGTTTRFVFLYRSETKRAEAVPFDALAQLSWDARRRSEREAEAAKNPPAPAAPAPAPGR